MNYLPAITWTLIAFVSLRFQVPNVVDAWLDLRIAKMPEYATPERLRQATFRFRVNLTRVVIVPLMLIAGVLAMFVPAAPIPPGTTVEVADRFILLCALYGNEIAFAFINYLEYKHRRVVLGKGS